MKKVILFVTILFSMSAFAGKKETRWICETIQKSSRSNIDVEKCVATGKTSFSFEYDGPGGVFSYEGKISSLNNNIYVCSGTFVQGYGLVVRRCSVKR